MPDERNPNHPVTRTLHDEWHKLTAMVMHKQGLSSIQITVADIESLVEKYGDGAGVVADARGGGLVLRLVTAEEADRIAREEGGLVF